MHIRVLAAWASALAMLASPALGQKGMPPTSVVIGGYAAMSDRDIVENLSQAASTSVFLDLLKLSGLADVMRRSGSVTLFVPTNEAFAAMPSHALDTLRASENRTKLVALISNHIVPGTYSSARLRLLLRMGKGQADLETISGGRLQIGTNGPTNLVIRTNNSIAADISVYDIKNANGVIFIIDRVVPPS